MYTKFDFKSKAALKRAVASGENVTLFGPGVWQPKTDGTEFVEGPHSPAPHTWYAQVTMSGGKVVKVK
jgi:hypothetical protein